MAEKSVKIVCSGHATNAQMRVATLSLVPQYWQSLCGIIKYAKRTGVYLLMLTLVETTVSFIEQSKEIV